MKQEVYTSCALSSFYFPVEGFGPVITGALWKGKPLIAAASDAIPLQIREGDAGYFCQTAWQTAQRVSYLHCLRYQLSSLV